MHPCEADIYEADIYEADICEADIYEADICEADICEADIYEADICEADICEADICEADICEADIYKKFIRWAVTLLLSRSRDYILCYNSISYCNIFHLQSVKTITNLIIQSYLKELKGINYLSIWLYISPS